jgi:hypothetical protein
MFVMITITIVSATVMPISPVIVVMTVITAFIMVITALIVHRSRGRLNRCRRDIGRLTQRYVYLCIGGIDAAQNDSGCQK